ncbi:hypothetical protein VT52_028790 [Streptomyces malaysiense]|uniref:Uncharacterized protein n=1 Tax=Streptomyces malaysiense TaxID=1428626 RepID=A0A1J4PSY9_9ACTN|nr:hypothetical protein VT52_028790 [Streptomyces malaysiense]
MLATAAVAAGVVVYGTTGSGGRSGGHAPQQAQAVTAAAFLDHTADVAYAKSASSGRYWKVRKQVRHTGAKSAPRTDNSSTADYYYARSMNAVHVVVGGQTHTKAGAFAWGLGPKELHSWSDLNRLPVAPAQLVSLMNSSKEYAGRSAFLQAGTLLGETPARPDLRAGLYRALARLHGVELVGTVKDSAGRSGTELVFTGALSTDRMVIDPRTSVLLEITSVSTKGRDRGETTRVTYLSSGPADKIG